MLACFLSCLAFGDLGALGEGAQVQVASADLSTIFVSGSVQGGDLNLEAELPPLANVVLIISRAPSAEASAAVQNVSSLRSSEVVSLSGFISPSGQDIMVQEPDGTISLKDWLNDHQIMLDLTK